MEKNFENEIKDLTAWLRTEKDLTAGRIALLLRMNGIDARQSVCAKLFLDKVYPQTGIVITPDKKIYQFAFRSETFTPHMAIFDEWLDLTSRYMEHEWRDEILTGLKIIEQEADFEQRKREDRKNSFKR